MKFKFKVKFKKRVQQVLDTKIRLSENKKLTLWAKKYLNLYRDITRAFDKAKNLG